MFVSKNTHSLEKILVYGRYEDSVYDANLSFCSPFFNQSLHFFPLKLGCLVFFHAILERLRHSKWFKTKIPNSTLIAVH